jgi:beta-lactamase class D
MRDSCVWYSQDLTRKLGIDKFKGYLEKFDYGNKDASGDKDENNGLTQSWLESSLQISPQEQVLFLQKFLGSKLGVSDKAYEITKKIIFVQELWGGWKLYGKTGGSALLGWFVGFIEKNGRKIVFASQILDDQKQGSTGVRARNNAYIQLSSIINELEK